MKICTESMMSCLRCIRRLAGANSPLLYTWENCLNSDSYYLRIQRKPEPPRLWYRYSASTFSTVVVVTPCVFNTAVELLDEGVLCRPNGMWWLPSVNYHHSVLAKYNLQHVHPNSLSSSMSGLLSIALLCQTSTNSRCGSQLCTREKAVKWLL